MVLAKELKIEKIMRLNKVRKSFHGLVNRRVDFVVDSGRRHFPFYDLREGNAWIHIQ